ncbi:MAG TPA: alkaline phosphatase family protein, partial [Vicinamibacterales bacterium]|nr:alkaline phosphatase family protein [Vicinamibacterales bacterium]
MLTQILATVLLIVVDGLRPDYVTPQQMPRLFELGQRGIVFNAHHSVFPTVTRVNGSTFVTGTYPETHGLLGNTIYVPAVSATKTLDTGDRENLVAVANTGPLLTTPTLGEILRRAGKRFAVFSSATTGATFILDQSAPARELPPHAIPNAAQHTRVVDAYLSDPSQD